MQGWNKKGMVFVPANGFLEFIPEEERLKSEGDRDYQPHTVLLSEVEPEKTYEVVITHFYGMPLLRYRMADLVRFVALKDEEAGINLPQMVFLRRADDEIDLAGMTRLDERTIWRAIADAGIKYVDWSACKGYEGSQSFLHLYIEMKEEKEAGEIEHLVDEQLKIVDVDYRDIDSWLGLQPVRVTLLSSGTFQRFYEERVRQGADLAHLKPSHIKPPQETIESLLRLSEGG